MRLVMLPQLYTRQDSCMGRSIDSIGLQICVCFWMPVHHKIAVDIFLKLPGIWGR